MSFFCSRGVWHTATRQEEKKRSLFWSKSTLAADSGSSSDFQNQADVCLLVLLVSAGKQQHMEWNDVSRHHRRLKTPLRYERRAKVLLEPLREALTPGADQVKKDLCLALWTVSSGRQRRGAFITAWGRRLPVVMWEGLSHWFAQRLNTQTNKTNANKGNQRPEGAPSWRMHGGVI